MDLAGFEAAEGLTEGEVADDVEGGEVEPVGLVSGWVMVSAGGLWGWALWDCLLCS